MKLPPETARWLVSLRFGVCAGVCLVAAVGWSVGILPWPRPLFAIAATMLGYNLLFWLSQRGWPAAQHGVERNILFQMLLDLAALTLLLYFTDFPRNPFLSYFVLPMIIAGMYLRNGRAYVVAGSATLLIGATLALLYFDKIPAFPADFHNEPAIFLMITFAALSSTLWIAVYFTTAIRRYVDRAHAELRQKEKLLGIGQLVAGIAHQIANPLDGIQNCLRRIGDGVKDDEHLAEYVKMMASALDRIERTAKRVQAFALPQGIALQATDVNSVVESTLPILETARVKGVRIRSELGAVPLVQGDPYTLQEVLFNLCSNAIAAMPHGGTMTLRTCSLRGGDDDQMNSVALEVADTGVGIPRQNFEKIFEPFFTTRAETGGTGLGLGLCRMLISEMGGRIEVRSVVKQGTVFTVVLNPAEVPAERAV